MTFIKVIATKACNLFTKAVNFIAATIDKVIDMTTDKSQFKAGYKLNADTGEAEGNVDVNNFTLFSLTAVLAVATGGAFILESGRVKEGAMIMAMGFAVGAVAALMNSEDSKRNNECAERELQAQRDHEFRMKNK